MQRHHMHSARYPVAVWALRKQDFLLISAFGAWAAMLGLLPVFALHALMR
jgi:hypothetical protein